MNADPHDEVTIAEYDPEWVATFNTERDRIAAALSSVEPRFPLIEHIGSTAVAGLASKPIIDIMVCYERLPEIVRIEGKLAAIGYAYVPKPEFHESHFFRRGETIESTIHLHITTLTSDFGRQMVRFRDALRASPAVAADYAAFKRRLAERFPHDRPAYTRAKGPYVLSVLSGLPSTPDESF